MSRYEAIPDSVDIIGIDSCPITEDGYLVVRMLLSDGGAAAINWPLTAIHSHAGRIREAPAVAPGLTMQ